MKKLQGEVLIIPKMSGNVGAKTINIGKNGDDGATFIPSVSADGVISWTNDKELPNPEPVNIKGVKGDHGKDGFSPIAKVTQTDDGAVITITDKNGTTEAVVKNGKDTASGGANVSIDGETIVFLENSTATIENETLIL